MDAIDIRTRHFFGNGSDRAGPIVRAIQTAEGGPECLVKAVNCSVGVESYLEAVDVTCRSLAHAALDYALLGTKESQASFIGFLANRWAPVGADNDPANLNANWCKNVLASLKAA